MDYANSMNRVFALSVVGASALVFYAALFTCLWSLRSPRVRNGQLAWTKATQAPRRHDSLGETPRSPTSGARKWTPFTCISNSWRSPRSPGFVATSSRRSLRSRSSSPVRERSARRGDRDGYIAIDRLWRNECLRAAREQRAWLAYPADVHMLRRVMRRRGARRPRDLIGAEKTQRQSMTFAEREQSRFVPLDVDARHHRDIAERTRAEGDAYRVLDRIGARAAPATNADREPRVNGRIHSSDAWWRARTGFIAKRADGDSGRRGATIPRRPRE